MKYLLILAVVLLLVWLWRSGRGDKDEDRQDAPASEDQPQEMVQCAHCGVHLPRNDAVPGRLALYCSPEHRHRAEP